MGNLHLRFDEGRGTFSVPSYSTDRPHRLPGPKTVLDGAGFLMEVLPEEPTFKKSVICGPSKRRCTRGGTKSACMIRPKLSALSDGAGPDQIG